MEIKDLLLPREKYAEARALYGPAPFTFEIEKSGQALFYFGANHSYDPANVQYQKLREYWEKFLTSTNSNERVVLVEGRLRDLEENDEIAIKLHAEGGLITRLAHKTHVIVECPDVSDKEMIGQLPHIDKKDFLLRWFVVWADNFKSHTDPKPDFEQSLEAFCKKHREDDLWSDVEITPENLKMWYRDVVGKEFNFNDNLNALIDPNKSGTLINEAARTMSDLREERVVAEIQKHWQEGKSIFIVFGASHIVIQKPALEKLLK